MKTTFRLVLCWIAFIAAIFLSGAISGILHLHAVAMPGGASPQSLFLSQVVASAVLVIGLWPLARSLAGPAWVRAAAFISFLLLALGVNGMIEAKKFTSFLDAGIGSSIVFYISIALFVGSAVGLLFGTGGQSTSFPHRGWPAWTWRLIAAWLGWPVVYFFFGMCIAPIVVPYYNAGVAGLRIPSMTVVITTQLIRSPIFLLTSLFFVALWNGSRRNLWLALGLAHAFTIGLYGLVGATFLPPVLRITHSIEMTCDAFAYTGLLVALFTAPAAGISIEPLPQQPHLLPH